MNHRPEAASLASHRASAASRWELLVPHVPRLLQLARRRLPSIQDAEDCVQDALIRAACADNLDPARTGAYLTTVVINLCADHGRARSVRTRLLARMVHDVADPSAEDLVCDRAEAVWFSRRLERELPDRERSVLRARAAGLTAHETAQQLSITVKAAECAFTRARKALRDQPARAVTRSKTTLGG